jgi:hypothetical protein
VRWFLLGGQIHPWSSVLVGEIKIKRAQQAAMLLHPLCKAVHFLKLPGLQLYAHLACTTLSYCCLQVLRCLQQLSYDFLVPPNAGVAQQHCL